MADRPPGNRRHHNSSNRLGRCGKDGVSYLLRPGEHEILGTWAKRTAERLSRRLTILGSLLLVIFAALVPLGAMAQEDPAAPSSDSVWYAAGTSLVRVNTESGQAAGSVPLSSQTSPVSSLASHPTDGSVAGAGQGTPPRVRHVWQQDLRGAAGGCFFFGHGARSGLRPSRR